VGASPKWVRPSRSCQRVIQLVDDQLLGAVLRGDPPPRRRAEVYTTGYWYVRLCQAVLSSNSARGVLSAPFRSLPSPTRDRAFQAVLELPDEIGLMSFRDLGPVIGHLRARHDLNMLGMEVLAAAVHLEAGVYLSAPSPRLQRALIAESRSSQVVK
jgi:hypothetical protein